MRKLFILVPLALVILAGCTSGQTKVEDIEVPPEVDVTFTKGNINADVVITEYSDYECPFCGKFTLEVLPQIQKDYIETGKVLFVFKDFPIPNHAHAQIAAEAAYCAGEQNEEKFWDYHVKIFEYQEELNKDKLGEIAEEVELNIGAFNTCLDSRKYQPLVLRNKNEGINAEVTATPTIFINDIKVVGLRPYENIQKIIETELRK